MLGAFVSTGEKGMSMMEKVRVFIGALALCLASAGATVVIAEPAHAAAPGDITPLAWGDCANSEVCLWPSTGGQGTPRVDVNFASARPCQAVNLGESLNDMADSLSNNENFTIYFYSYAGNNQWNWIETLSANEDQVNLPATKRNRIDLVSTCPVT
jgi:hypothetical protein